MTIQIHFRNTPGYRTDDGANAFIETGNTFPYSSGLGYNVGWVSPSGTFTYYNRTTGGNPKLGGCVYLPSWTINKYCIELPSTGDYEVEAAFGDYSVGYNTHFLFRDNTTQFGSTIGPGYTSGADKYRDATGVERSSGSDWTTNNARLSRTFSSTYFYLERPVSGDLSTVAYVGLFPVGGGDVTVITGLASETDSALSMTRQKIRTIGLTSETDSAFAVSTEPPPITVITGLASEADSAFSISRSKIRTISLSLEADSAFSITSSKISSVGLASEDDSALAMSRIKRRLIALATEDNTAFPVLTDGTITVATGLAAEVDSAFGITRIKRRSVELSTESDSALAVRPQKWKTISLATEADSALGVTSIPHILVGMASEVDSAFGVEVIRYTLVGMAIETDSAFPLVQATVVIPRHEVVRYTPQNPPELSDENAKKIFTYVLDEYTRIASALDLLAKGHVELTFKAPNKPYEGMARLADGTYWNPGAGKGVYVYFDGTWNKIS